MEFVIGVDLGGTRLRAALADRSGAIHAEVRLPTEADEGPSAVIARIVGCIEQMRTQLPIGGQLLGVGVGAPGPLDPYSGVVFTMPNLPGFQNMPLRQILSERTGLPIELGNDANAAALGEWRFGAGRGHSHLVYITVSTGVGGGVILNNRLLLGRLGGAAEVGHHIIDYQTRTTWEDLASGTALAHTAAQFMPNYPDSLLNDMTSTSNVTAAHVTLAARQGDALAQQLLRREAELIGIGLVNMLHLYSPEIILLGGGVMAAADLLLPGALQVVQERAFEVYRSVPIQLASLGDLVGVLGAVALVLEH